VVQGLLELNLVPEEWGGQTPMVDISAKKGIGIDELLQTVSLVAEEQMLMANPKRPGAGTVIEAHLDKRRGAVATLLVQAGTLRVGDIVCAGKGLWSGLRGLMQ
jgi:translation initiation factor IF-2